MSSLFDLVQIVLIDLSLAADNALVVGMAVAALPPATRKKAMIGGIAAATVLRIVMALFAIQLLHVTGLLLAGGLLLAWVSWKMAREFHHAQRGESSGTPDIPVSKKTSEAIWQIVVADVSMSLDNVLGVAGVARDHMGLLVTGLALSVLLMALASSQIAKLTARYPKVALVGVAIILYTAIHMIIDGGQQIGLWVKLAAFA
ncbi:MAG: YjbE family putative metal transport protein [Alphaproteobacteria bacterium]|nr:YjbE family putative metal transport protein [Alphaproteobacteria bacterium]